MKTIITFVLLCLCCLSVLQGQPATPLKSYNVGDFSIYNYTAVTGRGIRPDVKGDAFERVIGFQMIDGRQYAEIYNSYTRTYRYERADSNNVYVRVGNTDVRTHSISWKLGDTVNMKFMWHGCDSCKFVVWRISKIYEPNVLKDTLHSFLLYPYPMSNLFTAYDITYVRKYGINQLDTLGLNLRGRNDYLGGAFLKGAIVSGVQIGDTNFVTSVVEPPSSPLAQQKQGSSIQAAPRVAIAMSAENPFTSRTQVRYRLEQAVNVELAVYNVQGVRLTTFARTQQTAGDHTATWNGTNAEGQDVPAGTYFIVVFVNDRQAGEVKVMKVR